MKEMMNTVGHKKCNMCYRQSDGGYCDKYPRAQLCGSLVTVFHPTSKLFPYKAGAVYEYAGNFRYTIMNVGKGDENNPTMEKNVSIIYCWSG